MHRSFMLAEDRIDLTVTLLAAWSKLNKTYQNEVFDDFVG